MESSLRPFWLCLVSLGMSGRESCWRHLCLGRRGRAAQAEGAQSEGKGGLHSALAEGQERGHQFSEVISGFL